MKHLKQKLFSKAELSIYGYDRQEFMPIYRDGSLDNKREFLLYKFEKAVNILQAAYERLSVS